MKCLPSSPCKTLGPSFCTVLLLRPGPPAPLLCLELSTPRSNPTRGQEFRKHLSLGKQQNPSWAECTLSTQHNTVASPASPGSDNSHFPLKRTLLSVIKKNILRGQIKGILSCWTFQTPRSVWGQPTAPAALPSHHLSVHSQICAHYTLREKEGGKKGGTVYCFCNNQASAQVCPTKASPPRKPPSRVRSASSSTGDLQGLLTGTLGMNFSCLPACPLLQLALLSGGNRDRMEDSTRGWAPALSHPRLSPFPLSQPHALFPPTSNHACLAHSSLQPSPCTHPRLQLPIPRS